MAMYGSGDGCAMVMVRATMVVQDRAPVGAGKTLDWNRNSGILMWSVMVTPCSY